MGSKSSAPPAPDYTGAAQATAAGNLAMAQQAQAANMVNQNTPYGSLTYANNPNAANPWTANINLSPTGQALLNNANQAALNLGGIENATGQSVANTMGQPMSTANVPGLQSSVNTSGMPGVQSGINIGGMPQLNQGVLNQDEQAMYQQQAQYLDPQWNQAQQSFQTQMANQGLVPGDTAYNNAYQNFNLAKQQAYSNAQNQAITGGIGAANTLYGNQLQGYQTGVGAQLQNANLGNQAQQQLFGQGLSQANLNNATAAQQLQQNTNLYNMPLNTYNAVRSGAQVTNPTFNNQPTQQTVAGANLTGAAQNTYQANLNATNASNAANSGILGGLFSLGSAYLGGL